LNETTLNDLRSHVLVVTGGSRGIGAAIVRQAAQAGARVCFSYRRDHDAARRVCAELTASGAQVIALQADAADGASAARLLDAATAALGAPTMLVNNAGITGRYGSFHDLPEEALRLTFEVNVIGPMLLAQEAIRRWRKTGIPGRMVNITSIASTLGAPHEYVHYAASKAAIDAFTIGLGKELGAEGIRVNAVAPGTAMTDIHAAAGVPDRPAKVATRIPMQRVAEPEEIASAVLWLLSDAASYVTGTILRVSGGT
jgi:NAD(P)-dependent dehydrogenase (short-subunit alcohol dehydrogenase family)